MNVSLLKLKLITNMHVGNGDVNYNIIDNEVERDVTTGLPTINSSGVKGAFREYIEKYNPDKLKDWFGTGERQGLLKFLSADLLGLAVRASSGKEPFYLVSDETITNLIKEKANYLGIKLEEKKESLNDNQPSADGYNLNKNVMISEENIYYFENAMEIRNISLPVVARNCLDDGGISKNLWYEEVVPHQSVFITAVLSESEEELNSFVETIKDKYVQFGGNATIGYGICKVTVIGTGEGA